MKTYVTSAEAGFDLMKVWGYVVQKDFLIYIVIYTLEKNCCNFSLKKARNVGLEC